MVINVVQSPFKQIGFTTFLHPYLSSRQSRIVNSGYDQSSSKPVRLLSKLQQMLMVSHSPSKTGDRSSTNSPELPQEDDHRSHATGDDLCNENNVADIDKDNHKEEQQP